MQRGAELRYHCIRQLGLDRQETRAASSFAPCLAAACERYLEWRRPQTFTCHQPARSTTSILIFIAGPLGKVARADRGSSHNWRVSQAYRAYYRSQKEPATRPQCESAQFGKSGSCSKVSPEWPVSRWIRRSPKIVAGVQKPPGVAALSTSSARHAAAWPSILPVEP